MQIEFLNQGLFVEIGDGQHDDIIAASRFENSPHRIISGSSIRISPRVFNSPREIAVYRNFISSEQRDTLAMFEVHNNGLSLPQGLYYFESIMSPHQYVRYDPI